MDVCSYGTEAKMCIEMRPQLLMYFDISQFTTQSFTRLACC